MRKKKIQLKTVVMALFVMGLGNGLQAADGVLLKMKWEKGKKYLNNMVMRMKMNMAVPRPSVTDTTMNISMKQSVLEELPQGGFKFGCLISFEKMRMNMGGAVTLTLDSDSAPVSGVANPFAGLKGKSGRFQYSTDAQGKVTDIQGLKEFVDSLSGLSGSPGAPKTKKIFSEESFKEMLPGAVDFLPHDPVKVGDTWPNKMSVNSQGLKVAVSSTYTFAGWEKKAGRDCALLTFTGTMTMDQGGDPTIKGVKTEIKSSSLSGKVWFDPKQGQALETQGHNHMVMNISVNTQPAQAGVSAGFSMNMTMEMDQDIEMKLDKIE